MLKNAKFVDIDKTTIEVHKSHPTLQKMCLKKIDEDDICTKMCKMCIEGVNEMNYQRNKAQEVQANRLARQTLTEVKIDHIRPILDTEEAYDLNYDGFKAIEKQTRLSSRTPSKVTIDHIRPILDTEEAYDLNYDGIKAIKKQTRLSCRTPSKVTTDDNGLKLEAEEACDIFDDGNKAIEKQTKFSSPTSSKKLKTTEKLEVAQVKTTEKLEVAQVGNSPVANRYSLYEKIFTCVVPNCNLVFDTKKNNCDHYRSHANITPDLLTCSKCLLNHEMVNGTRKRCEHVNIRIRCTTCHIKFDKVCQLADHKLFVHGAVVLCGDALVPGCPICSAVFPVNGKATSHYKRCFTELNRINPPAYPCNPVDVSSVAMKVTTPDQKVIGVLKCQDKGCKEYALTLSQYIAHAKNKHGVNYCIKDSTIQLCPLCDNNIINNNFVEHISMCTDSMRVGHNTQNYFGCIYCKSVIKNMNSREFREHFMYCKSFELCFNPNSKRTTMNCKNCTFVSEDQKLSIQHASQTCLYLQVKRKLALIMDERKTVEERMKTNLFYSLMDQSPPVDYDDSTNMICDISRRRHLKGYDYLCIYCGRRFFNLTVFNDHLKLDGTRCRPIDSWYCGQCVSDFTSHSDYVAHLENIAQLDSVPASIPIPFVKDEPPPEFKQEPMFYQCNDNNTNNYDIKDMSPIIVNVNNGHPYALEPINYSLSSTDIGLNVKSEDILYDEKPLITNNVNNFVTLNPAESSDFKFKNEEFTIKYDPMIYFDDRKPKIEDYDSDI